MAGLFSLLHVDGGAGDGHGGSSGTGSGSGGLDYGSGPVFVPLLGVLTSVFAWGTFAMPMKMDAVVKAELHPAIFQFYISIGIFLSSWLVLLVEPFAFTWWGLPGACAPNPIHGDSADCVLV